MFYYSEDHRPKERTYNQAGEKSRRNRSFPLKIREADLEKYFSVKALRDKFCAFAVARFTLPGELQDQFE